MKWFFITVYLTIHSTTPTEQPEKHIFHTPEKQEYKSLEDCKNETFKKISPILEDYFNKNDKKSGQLAIVCTETKSDLSI